MATLGIVGLGTVALACGEETSKPTARPGAAAPAGQLDRTRHASKAAPRDVRLAKHGVISRGPPEQHVRGEVPSYLTGGKPADSGPPVAADERVAGR